MSAQIPELRSTEQLKEKWMEPEVISGSRYYSAALY